MHPSLPWVMEQHVSQRCHRAEVRPPSNGAMSANIATHCPQLVPSLVTPTALAQRPTPVITTPPVLRFGDTGGMQHVDLLSRPIRLVSRGGFAVVASLKFTSDPATASADLAVLALRVPGTDAQSVLLYTDGSAAGALTAGLCDAGSCVYATAAAPTVDVWLTVALRFVATPPRLDLWTDSRVAGDPWWPGLGSLYVTVRCNWHTHDASWVPLWRFVNVQPCTKPLTRAVLNLFPEASRWLHVQARVSLLVHRVWLVSQRYPVPCRWKYVHMSLLVYIL